MPLPSPNLDDRDFQQLVAEARRIINQTSPDWTDQSPGDPGMVLLELFAHLTETMIYRLNRLPQKVYIELLRLIGVRLQPPAAASATLVFSRAQPDNSQPITIPRATRVTAERFSGSSEPPIFITVAPVVIAAGQDTAEVLAHHCELIEAELVGIGTGLAGQVVSLRRPPVIAATGDQLDLLIGIEARAGELGERAPAIQYNGKAFRVWREVEHFANLGGDSFAYIADRNSGVITFAPATRAPQEGGGVSDSIGTLAAVPAANREIRVWYRRGGGADGNLVANSLTKLKDSIAGVQVTNPNAATGGRAAESLDNALIRGPQQIHSLERAVTARDFEQIALYSSRAVARARALTRAALWTYATPGTVETLIVPYVAATTGDPGVTAETLRQNQTDEARAQIQAALDERRPLGTTCLVNWARYKTVSVAARVVVRREEDQAAVRARVIARLHQIISPLPTPLNALGWQFGQALRVSHVFDAALAEPGVRWVDSVRLRVDDVPDTSVSSVAVDAFQPHTWYVGAGSTLYRSLNDGDGWEPAGSFPNETIDMIEVHPNRAGIIAVATTLAAGGSGLHISYDCGETWTPPFSFGFKIHDLAWTIRDDVPLLLLAADKGLFELTARRGGSPVPLLVDRADQTRGFYAVVVSTDVRGVASVAAAALNQGGVYLSSQGGKTNSYRNIGLANEDIRRLAVQYDGPRSFLWAGAFTPSGDDPGKGAFRWELRGTEDPPEGWRAYVGEWSGGSCRSLAFIGDTVAAASHRRGVMLLDPNAADPKWRAPRVDCGLPQRDDQEGKARLFFQPVYSIAADPQRSLILAGGARGVYRSSDEGANYINSSAKEFSEKVTLPETWLFVSGQHNITVVSENEANRD